MKKKLLVLLLSLSMVMSGTVMTSAEALPENENQTPVEQTVKEETPEQNEDEDVKVEAPEQNEDENVKEEAPEQNEKPAPQEELVETPNKNQKKDRKEEPAQSSMPKLVTLGTTTDPSPVSGLVYDGDSHILISNIQTYAKIMPSNNDVKYVYKVDSGSYGSIADADKALALRRTDAGEYKVYYKTQKYNKSKWDWVDNSSENYVTVNIAKATGASASAATGLVENGQSLCLIGSTKTNKEQTLYYSTDNATWSKTKPTVTAAGNYHVYWKTDESKNYKANSGDFVVDVGGTGEITAGCLSLDKTHFDYLFGVNRSPKVTVVVKGRTLKEDVDYTVSGDTSKSAPGKYTLTVTGKGSYTGSDSMNWTVGTDINDVTMSLAVDSYEYDGNSHEPIVVGLAAITKSGDTSKTDRGNYTLRVDGKNDLGYYGTRNFSWEITARDLSKCVVTVDSPEYTGDEITVTPVVRYGLLDLLSGDTVSSSDYEVTGNKATDAGKHTLTITAKADKNIKGSKEVEWTIQKKSATATVTKVSGLTYDGKSHALVSTSNVTEGCQVEYICVDNEWAMPAMVAYAEIADNWSTSVPTKINASTYYVLYRIKGSGNYKDVSWNGDIIEVTIKKAKLQVEWSNTELTYNGTLQGPTATISGGLISGDDATCQVTGKKLNAGTDYTATADLSLLDKFEGNYELSGNTTTKFSIKPRAFDSSYIVAEQLGNLPYTDEVQKPIIYVYDNGITRLLIEDVDFEFVSYSKESEGDRKAVGTYTATIQGKGNYESAGKIDVSWKISAGKMQAVLDEMTYEYDGTDKSEAVLEHLVVTNLKGNKISSDNYEIVASGTDAGCYDVNSLLNPYKITVQGKGNYAGDPIELHYWIIPRDIDKADISLDATSFYYNGETQAPVVTVTDEAVAGETPLTDADYVLSGETTGVHANISVEGQPLTYYEIFVTGKGNYTGIATAKWSIKSIDLAECDVTGVPTYNYDGCLHTVDESTLTVTYKDGDNTIVVPKDNYQIEVTPQSNAGHYTATILNDNEFIVDPIRYQDVVGEKTINWFIDSVGANVTIDEIPDQVYTSAAIIPKSLVVRVNGTPVTDYSVRYENNVEVGTAKVYVSVSGNVYGSAETSFNIVYGEEHKVKFYADGELWSEQTVKHGEKAVAPEAPSKEGYTFAGWTYGVEGGKCYGDVYLFSSEVICDLVLNAKWVNDANKENIIIEIVPSDIGAKVDINPEDIPLTDEEEKAIENGSKLRVEVIINASEFTPSQEEQDAISGTLSGNKKIGLYLDITINKYLDDKFSGSVHETINPIKITVAVPEELRADNRLFFVARLHDGVAAILTESKAASDAWEVSFSSDKFSTYALGYEDVEKDDDNDDDDNVDPKNPDKDDNDKSADDKDADDSAAKTGDEAPFAKMFTIFTLAVMGAWVVLRSRKGNAE